MSLEEAADNTQVVACRDMTRVGLQDDMCAIAEREKLARTPGAEGRGTGLWASTDNASVDLNREARVLSQLTPSPTRWWSSLRRCTCNWTRRRTTFWVQPRSEPAALGAAAGMLRRARSTAPLD